AVRFEDPDGPGPQIDRDGARGGQHRVDDLAAFELAGQALAWSGDADRGDDLARVVDDRRCDAADAFLALLEIEAVATLADDANLLQQTLRGGDGVGRQRIELLRRRPRLDLLLGQIREQRLAKGGAVRRQDRAGAGPHEADRLGRQHAFEVDDLPVIENR